MHLDRRTIGRFAHPDIKVLAFSGFEKKHIIAVIQFGKLIQLIQLGFGIEFCIFAAVREKSVEIVEEVPVAAKQEVLALEGPRDMRRRNRITYRYVTPLELRIRTLCLFFFSSFSLSGLSPLAFKRDL